MRILFYDWALHTIGGGQKFDCKIAEHLSKRHNVDILSLFPVNKKRLEETYTIDLSRIKNFRYLYKKSRFNPTLLHLLSFRKVAKITTEYDLFLNADAHENVKPNAKYNIMYCHFFEPKWPKPAKSLIDFVKLSARWILKTIAGNYCSKYDALYCNSLYTKKWLKKLWNVNAEVIYPPVDIPKKIQQNKENLITSTGRLTQDKNYESVIDCFKEIYDSLPNTRKYKLVICGVLYERDYYEKLKNLAFGYPVKILTNLSDKELKRVYSKSKIFIQAKGLGISEAKYPALLEHFGMAAAEAMSYGCVPVVLDKAGYKETVENGKSGFLFNTKEEAVEKIKLLVENEKLLKEMSRNAREKVKKFSLERMQKQIDEATKEIINKCKIS